MKVIVKTAGGEQKPLNVDAEKLAQRLRESTEAEVRFDDPSRALYATAGGNYRQVPIGVVVPRIEQDIVQHLYCRIYTIAALQNKDVELR